ncbi:DUF255 domain-containing protein [Puteibacter caeruleilacunae]|nr:DUF255 domain-containing protein [Puteibacter caeruleilacunae]
MLRQLLPCLILFLATNLVNAQSFLKGTVTNKKGAPVAYANICFLNSPTIGSTTDINGIFKLELPTDKSFKTDSLIFMHLNYKNQTVAFKDLSSHASIILKPDLHSLDEIAVYAQFAQHTYKRALSYASEAEKPLLLFFTAQWCGFCHKYKKLFSEENEISDYLKEHYKLVICDILTKPGMKLKRLYSAGPGLPQFVIITPQERIIAKHHGGWKTKQECLDFLKQHHHLPQAVNQLKAIRQTKYDFTRNELRKQTIPKLDEQLEQTNWKVLLNLGLMNFTHLSSTNPYGTNKIGYDFGVLLNYTQEESKFSYETGILFSSQGGRHANEGKNFRINYLEVPFRINYKFSDAPFPMKLCLSPYLAYGVSAKNKFTDTRIRFGNKASELSRWDYGITPGIKLSPIGNMEIFAGYKFGLNNISNSANWEGYNRGVYILISIGFLGKYL